MTKKWPKNNILAPQKSSLWGQKVTFCQDTFDHDKGQKSAISGRSLHWRLSTGFFAFSPVFYVQFSKTSHLKIWRESSEKSSGENRVKSCHVCGCHGFFGPDNLVTFESLFTGRGKIPGLFFDSFESDEFFPDSGLVAALRSTRLGWHFCRTKMVVLTILGHFRKRAEYGFGEYGFKHRTQWVFRGSLSSRDWTQWVLFSLLFVCKRELTEFFAELTEFAPKLSEAQWVLFSETVLSKQYSATVSYILV